MSTVIEYISEQMRTGKMTASQANVEKVRMNRVQLVTSRIPAQVRNDLCAAVKIGYLNHKKKIGGKPEVFYHPNFEYLANGMRSRHELNILNSIKGCCR